MSLNRLITDTGPLSYHVAGGVLGVLQALFGGRIHIAPAAMQEVESHPEVWGAVRESVQKQWLTGTTLSPGELMQAADIRRQDGLHTGESEALAIAATRGWVFLLHRGRARPRRVVAGAMKAPDWRRRAGHQQQ